MMLRPSISCFEVFSYEVYSSDSESLTIWDGSLTKPCAATIHVEMLVLVSRLDVQICFELIVF